MEPPIQYATTSDGARIAYTVAGDGPPLVACMEPMVSHVQLEWRHPVNGRVLRGLARHFKLIRLDFRGCGLSDRRQAQTLDEYVLDIEAVVHRLGLQRFALGAVQFATLPAL